MELRTFNRDKGPVLAAVIALLALGLGSIFLTWQNIRRQRELVDQHLQLTGAAVVQSVEANLTRVMHSLRRSPDAATRFFPSVRELFQEMTASGDVVFIGIFDEDGRLIASSAKDNEPRDLVLPEQIIAPLELQGRWAGVLEYNGSMAMFSAIRARPGLAILCEGARLGFPYPPETMSPPQRKPQHDARPQRGMGQGMGHGMGRNMEEMGPPPDLPGPARTPGAPSLFLVVGLNPQRHLEQFQAYRRAALLQTSYVFGAATLLWFLAFAYLRRRAQAMKATQLERFHSKLLDNMPDGLVTLDAEGTILSANGSAARLLLAVDGEQDATALLGRNWSEFPFAELPGADDGPAQWRQFEHDGRVLEILSLSLQAGASPEGAEGERLVLLRDRTRMCNLEEDLAEAKRLAAIGSLAAGVAHEIRNPLSSLRGFAQLFATKLKGQEPLASYASTMVQEADRLNRVVTDLLFLARPRELAPAEVDLPRLIESLRGLLRFDLDHKAVAPKVELAAGTVFADEDALKQALLNLLVNALDALPETGGSLTIASARSEAAGIAGEAGVWLSVADNGQGMDETVRAKAFEPFFTDKRKGTGLGLAIVQGIMRGHRGRAVIESSPGSGTVVRLFFPDPDGRTRGGEAHDTDADTDVSE